MTRPAPDRSRARTARVSAKLKEWFRPPRRLRITRGGALLTGAIVALGFAALNTGNNLLYLVLGALLGLIMVSGWLSEQMLRRNQIERRVPRAATAGEPLRLAYQITNHKRRLPTVSIELREAAFNEAAYLQSAWPGRSGVARTTVTVRRRGVYPLSRIVLSTAFPFGLFIKERDIEVRGYLVVWPRTDRIVRRPRLAGEPARRTGENAAVTAGSGRGDYRGLRGYVPGDDPRDVHWRSTARLGQPMVREYEREAAQALWVCLDVRVPADDRAEEAVEIAAALVTRAIGEGQRVGFASNETVIDLGSGPGQLERVLDALARVRFRTDAPPLVLPASSEECVLVTSAPTRSVTCADLFEAGGA